METLRLQDDLIVPDWRNTLYRVVTSDGAERPYVFEDLYADVRSIKLDAVVPDKIRSHFAQAQNLAVYAWYCYSFHVTAQFMGFVTVEFALQEKCGKPRARFKDLISEAVNNGWINDEGFAVAKGWTGEKRYVETLIDLMPALRNELAHGSSRVDFSSTTSLRICADFVNQLFLTSGDR